MIADRYVSELGSERVNGGSAVYPAVVDGAGQQTSMRIDYLRFTVRNYAHPLVFFAEYFGDYLGALHDTGHGSRGFSQVYECGRGAFLHALPTLEGDDYFSVELRGEACGCLPPSVFRDLADFAQAQKLYPDQGIEVRVSRIDFAVDYAPFTPYMIHEAVLAELFRCKATRKNIDWHVGHWRKQECLPGQSPDDVAIGCETITFGGRASARYLRIYNRHGFTRVELELKSETADLAFQAVCSSCWQKQLGLAISMIADFLMVDLPYWYKFVSTTETVSIRIGNYRGLHLDGIKDWVKRQVAPALLAWMNVEGSQAVYQFLGEYGGGERQDKYRHMLEMANTI